jgi:hypothetical protein
MNKPYNIQNTNICNGIFHISFFKALLINEGEQDSGQNDPDSYDMVWGPFAMGSLALYLKIFICTSV